MRYLGETRVRVPMVEAANPALAGKEKPLYPAIWFGELDSRFGDREAYLMVGFELDIARENLMYRHKILDQYNIPEEDFEQALSDHDCTLAWSSHGNLPIWPHSHLMRVPDRQLAVIYDTLRDVAEPFILPEPEAANLQFRDIAMVRIETASGNTTVDFAAVFNNYGFSTQEPRREVMLTADEIQFLLPFVTKKENTGERVEIQTGQLISGAMNISAMRQNQDHLQVSIETLAKSAKLHHKVNFGRPTL